ncbi:MAG: response regulator [bacterium]|nr:response regulator [bacterium]
MRILYVEDNPANLFLVKRVAQGHEVINYIDGEEALRNFQRDRPDLVLMDLQLAGPLNGLEAVKQLRGQGVQTPIVAVTAYAMVGDRERCLAAGCDDYLAKPIPIPQLLAMIQKYGAQTAARQTATQETVTAAPSTPAMPPAMAEKPGEAVTATPSSDDRPPSTETIALAPETSGAKKDDASATTWPEAPTNVLEAETVESVEVLIPDVQRTASVTTEVVAIPSDGSVLKETMTDAARAEKSAPQTTMTD